MIGILLILLLCTLIGYLLGNPGLGLVVGLVAAILALYYGGGVENPFR